MLVAIRMVEAFVLVRVGSGEALSFTKTIKEEITKIKGVKDIYGVFGRYDFVVRVETKSLEELGNFVTDKVRGISGVLTTETLVIGF
jgi:DNA-binding Lrp family transcriptional regulator